VNAIYPGTESADSTVATFFFYPDGTTDINVPLVVKLSGTPLTSELSFGLKVVAEETTANPEEYTIASSYSFRANTIADNSVDIRDTIYVQMHRSNRLENLPQGVRLVVELIPNTQVKVGQVERARAKIILTTNTTRPLWWSSTVASNLMGVYTEKKYKLFLNHIDTNAEMSEQLIQSSPDQAIKLVMKFKEWLNAQNPPIEEDDGSLMQVAI
jgi:hypothetical protein